MPRDENRYGFRLWLDTSTGLLLRSELVDMKGAKLEIFQFALVRIGEPISDADLTPAAREGARTSHLELDAAPPPVESHAQWQAGWLPDGFKMAAADIRRTPESSQAVHTLMYSDGLAVFSVFIESMPEAGAANLISRSGATVAVTETVLGGPDQSNHLVTVVGEIPTATAQRIARSVRYPAN
jgi:sigma-E factor negative regulatory protein RseB